MGRTVGLERVVTFSTAASPDWNAVVAKLKELGETPILRMIDGQLAFPDEVPEATWSELRVGLAGGMVTLRRQASAVRCLVWGNADAAMILSREKCCWAVAAAGNGTIHADDGTVVTATEFRSMLE